MSDNVPVTEVFEEVEPDPDAIITSYGAETLEELVDGPGDHDPTTDEELDADVETAAELLGELADVQLDRIDAEAAGDAGPVAADVDPTEGDAVEPGDADDLGDTVVSDPTVDVLPGDGVAIDEFLGLDELSAAETRERDGLVLVGPDPAGDRVSNDAFGAGLDAASTPGGPDRRRESEFASSVFGWAS